MTSTLKPGSSAFIVINPVAGFADQKSLKKICEAQFHAAGWQTRFHITQEGENLSSIVQKETAAGTDLVVAAGGDGTIAAVAAGMLHSNVPLGIIPTGTWNAIARHFFLPANPQRAIALMLGKHTIRKLDMMGIGNTAHAMNLGVGFSANMVDNTVRQKKRKLGIFAYLKQFFTQLFGLQMPRYYLEADGILFKGRATEIMVANYGIVGLHFIEDRLNIHPDDGKVDILILRARTIFDLPLIIWEMVVRGDKHPLRYHIISASRKIEIKTKPPAQVQADGELLGSTPVKVTVIPRAVLVIAP